MPLPSRARAVSLILPLLAGCSSEAGTEAESSSTSAESETSSSTTETDTETETDTDTGTGTDTDGDPPRPARLLMTSDWRAHRLSLLDYAALRDGAATRDEALWKTIELPDLEPGPLEAEISPDGSLAVVAVAPGFFAGAAGALAGAGPGTVPEGGSLVIVEIDTGTILAQLETAQYPMGIAITDDGTAAWTANYGGSGQSGATVSHIDLVSLTIVEEIDVGPSPEQLDLLGDRAIVNTAGDGSVRLFSITDPIASLSAPVMTSNDPSWVLYLADGMQAVAINSLGPPGYTLLDTSDPQNPTVIETIEVTGIAYAAAHGRDPAEILMPVIAGNTIDLQVYDTATGELVQQITAPVTGFPLAVAFDPDDELAFVPVPGSNVLIVANLATGEHREIDWQNVPGPTYAALE